MPNASLLLVEHGGHVMCAPAADARQRTRQWTIAWKISVVLDGGTVRVLHVLPGLHLDLRAKRLSEHFPPDPFDTRPSLREEDAEWRRVEELVCAMLEAPTDCGQARYESYVLSCTLRQSLPPHDADVPISYTMRCQWPRAPGFWHA